MRCTILPSVAACLALGLAACGSGPGGQRAAMLEITVSGSRKAPVFEVPRATEAGLTEISLTNDTRRKAHGQLVRVEGDHGAAAVAAEMRKASRGRPVEDWLQARGGVGPVPAGETRTVTQVLEAGTYHVVGRNASEEPSTFEVTGGRGGELPDAGNTIIATDHRFSGSPKAGEPITFVNDGEQWHQFIGARIQGDATLDDVVRARKGERPVDDRNSVTSTVMDGGVSQTIANGLKAGRYAFVCFISDREGGPPHIAKGMISEITVE